MKLIKEMAELIEDEICDVKKYAKLAIELKDEQPALARVLYDISTQEDLHHSALHNEVVKLIENYKRDHGEPPAEMMAVYEYVHRRHIDKLAHARRYQEMFKNG
jgi:sulfur relay (sulfurtransferase) DsrC/TusE family protein